MKKLIIGLLILNFQQALAWGGRGHHSICSAAVHLVQDKDLKEFLSSRPHIMGHLCNIPDTYWRSLPPTVSKSGDAGHYIHLEMVGFPGEMTENFATLDEQLKGKPNLYKKDSTVFNVADEVGSLWWRADQFYRRVIAHKESLSALTAPKGGKEEQDENLPFNKEVYEIIVNMGLIGHFVGDSSQPFHAIADYDGWDNEHGGIHGYYEEVSVSAAPGDLEAKIIAKARTIKSAPWLDGKKSIVGRMQAMSLASQAEYKKVLALDPIVKKSVRTKDKGMEIRTKAERQSAQTGWKKFEPLIVAEMARSALLLARLWDQEYVELGRPNLAAYRSYKFPFTPDFVPLDYVPAAAKPTM